MQSLTKISSKWRHFHFRDPSFKNLIITKVYKIYTFIKRVSCQMAICYLWTNAWRVNHASVNRACRIGSLLLDCYMGALSYCFSHSQSLEGRRPIDEIYRQLISKLTTVSFHKMISEYLSQHWPPVDMNHGLCGSTISYSDNYLDSEKYALWILCRGCYPLNMS